jgi:hypothetical protein
MSNCKEYSENEYESVQDWVYEIMSLFGFV